MPDSHAQSAVAHQFDDAPQQHHADTLGMWLFLATEVMLFGGLFTGYAVYRHRYLAGFIQASGEMHAILGAINTAVLLCSSLAMALAVHAATTRKKNQLVGFLILTIVLGLAFLGIKATEYYLEYKDHLIPGLNFAWDGPDPKAMFLFMSFYFTMTGLHALHMTGGITVMTILAILAARGHFTAKGNSNTIEMAGLYWHFVDIVWVFLFPLLYLVR